MLSLSDLIGVTNKFFSATLLIGRTFAPCDAISEGLFWPLVRACAPYR